MRKGIGQVVRMVLFLGVLCGVLLSIQNLFGIEAFLDFDNVVAFQKERKNSMDAVYIGGSDVHAFWQPAFCWEEYGFATWSYSVDSITPAAVKNLLIEAQKRQPDSLYIISLNTFKKDSTVSTMEDIHRVVDYLPLSRNKIDLVEKLTAPLEDYQGLNKLEFYLPMIRFHSRWDDLKAYSLDAKSYDYKSSIRYSAYLQNVSDITSKFILVEANGEAAADVRETFLDLLDYCEAQHISLLFTKVPQVMNPVEQISLLQLEKILRERGIPYIDLMSQAENIGIDTHMDFYNTKHTNVHGSLKVTHAIATYLAENYPFQDKRNASGWESWDQAATDYLNYVSSETLPFEREHAPRSRLQRPVLGKTTAKGTSLTISWQESFGAEGYAIYRKSSQENRGHWQEVARVERDVLSYTEENLKASTKYTYTVVPIEMKEEQMQYGFFDVTGISGTTGGK